MYAYVSMTINPLTIIIYASQQTTEIQYKTYESNNRGNKTTHNTLLILLRMNICLIDGVHLRSLTCVIFVTFIITEKPQRKLPETSSHLIGRSAEY